MPISWSTVIDEQDQSLEAELARRELSQNSALKILRELEGQRATRADEEYKTKKQAEDSELEKRRIDETTKLRTAQQDETMRRNREIDADRDTAGYMQAIGMLEPGTVIRDPRLIEQANKRGMGDLFKADPTTGLTIFTGTAAQLRQQAREDQANARAAAAERRADERAAQFERTIAVAQANAQNSAARTDIMRDKEKRIAAAQAAEEKLPPQLQVAFREIVKQRMKERRPSFLHSITGGMAGDPEEDTLTIVESAYRQVTGKDLTPSTPDGAKGPGSDRASAAGGDGAAASPTLPPARREIAPGIFVTEVK
jgi:hypothetical protein